MEIWQKAKACDESGDLEEAAKQYKIYIDSNNHVPAEVYYEAGSVFLRLCEKQFREDFYEDGFIFFAKAYNADYIQKEQLYKLMYEIACVPNIEEMKENYSRQVRIFKSKYDDLEWPVFEKLPFVLFPTKEESFILYDKRKECFLPYHMVRMEYQPYIIAMLHSEVTEKAIFSFYYKKLSSEKRGKKLLEILEPVLYNLAFKKEMLGKVDEFKELFPCSAKFEQFMGSYYFYAKQDMECTRLQIIEGLKKHPLNLELRELAANFYLKNGSYDQAAANFLFLAIKDQVNRFYEPSSYQISQDICEKISQCLQSAKQKSPQELQKVLAAMTLIVRYTREFIARKVFCLNEAGGLEIKADLALGEFLEKVDDELHYFVGVYAEYTRIDTNAMQTDFLMQAGHIVQAYRRTYDILDARLTKNIFTEKKNYSYLVPFMATDYSQLFKISYKGKSYQQAFGKLECNFLRAEDSMEISSEKDFALGNIIPLQHDKKRKKVVLSILIDTLSYSKIQEQDFALMPNVKRFFEKGVIFANNFTPAEWTLASETAIQTGCYPDKTQIFHPNVFVQMSSEYHTTAQLMRDKGYYCMLLEGILTQRLCNLYKGFHRVIGDESMDIDTLLAIALKNMRALQETDLFMHMHIFDVHVHRQPPALEQKVHIDAADYLELSMGEGKSVGVKGTGPNRRNYDEQVRHVDQALFSVFSYLEQTYKEDEYLVVLHSDHGSSLIGDEPQMLKKGLANAAFMARGGGVPSYGIVKDEMTNTLDLYASLAYLCNCHIAGDLDSCLPKAFGGLGREYSISNTLYPGQTYKLSIRTLSHVFYLETTGVVTMEGLVNLNEFTYQIFMRDDEHIPVQNEELAAYFIEIALEHAKRIHDFTL